MHIPVPWTEPRFTVFLVVLGICLDFNCQYLYWIYVNKHQPKKLKIKVKQGK